MKIPFDDLATLAEEHGCAAEKKPDGAVHIRGQVTPLKNLWRAIGKRWRNYPRFVTEHKINGVSQPDAPEIQVHPQVVQ